MSTHTIHAPDIIPGDLDPACPRCCEHRLGTLDDEHLLVACGIVRSDLTAFIRRYPQLEGAIMNINAMSVRNALDQREPF